MDLSLWETQYNVIYKHHVEAGRYPSDAKLALSYPGNWAGDRYDLSNPEAISKTLVRKDKACKDLYFRITPVINRAYGPTERGSAADNLGVPCIYADLDTSDGIHEDFRGVCKGMRHPTSDEVIQMLDELLPPTLIVKSGGGVHAYWSLKSLIKIPLNSAGTPDRQHGGYKLLKAFDDWLVGEAIKRGFGMDTGIVSDLARVLRVAGSRNFKDTAPRDVTIFRYVPGLVYTRGDLIAAVPAEPAAALRAASASAGHASLRPAGGKLPGGSVPGLKRSDYAAIDAFSRDIPVSALMEHVWGMETDAAEDAPMKEWYYPRSDGSVSKEHKSAITIVLETGTEVAYAHSHRLQEEWGVDDFHTAIASWNLVNACMDGDSSFSRTLIKGRKKVTPEFLDMMKAANTYRHEAAAKKAA